MGVVVIQGGRGGNSRRIKLLVASRLFGRLSFEEERNGSWWAIVSNENNQKNQVNLENTNFNVIRQLQKQLVQKIWNLEKWEKTFQRLVEDLFVAVFSWKEAAENLGLAQAAQYCQGTVQFLVNTHGTGMTKSPGSQLKAQEGHSLESVTNQRQTDYYNQTAAQPQNTSVPDWIHVISRFIGQ